MLAAAAALLARVAGRSAISGAGVEGSSISSVRERSSSVLAGIFSGVSVAACTSSGVGVSSSACRAALRGQDLHSGGLLRACFAPAHWRDQARKLARSWKHMWFHYEKFKRMKAGKRSTRVLQVAYEEVLKPDAREAALRRIVDFLRLPHAVSDATLRCAFALADDPRTHRAAQSDASQQYVTLQQAYANASLVCDMWKSFRRKASKAGYAPIGGVRCQE